MFHSIVNIKIYKVIFDSSAPAITLFEMLTFGIFDLEKVGHDHGVQLSQLYRSMSNIKVYKNRIAHSCATSHHFQILAFEMFDLKKYIRFMGYNIRNGTIAYIKTYTCSLYYFYFWRKKPVLTKVTHRHMYTETGKAMATGEIVDLSQNEYMLSCKRWDCI